MSLPDDLSTILDRIKNNEQTEADMAALRQLLSADDAAHKGLRQHQIARQLGKYNVNIGQGQDIQIGDRYYVEWNDAAIQALIQVIQKQMSAPPVPLSPEAQKDVVCQFLEAIENNFKYVEFFHERQHKFVLKEQYIPIQVTLERRYRHEVETTLGYAESEAELKLAYALKGMDEQSQPSQVDWKAAIKKYQRIIVLADPGMGKSTLLKMEAGLTAQEERQNILCKSKPVNEVVFPLFLRLVDFIDEKLEEILNAEIIDAISIIIRKEYSKVLEYNVKISSAIIPLLKEKLSTGKCLLLLDALDEVPKVHRNRLAEKLNRFARDYPCPIISTSRILGYSDEFNNFAKDVEIAPFSQKQTKQYIDIWFRNAAGYIDNDSVSAQGLIQELRQKPQIAGLAQNPLLLSLLCSLYQEKDWTLPARRCQIYEKAVGYMLSKWRIHNQRQYPKDGWVIAKRKLLEALAYQFSCEGKEIFSLRELHEKIEQYLRIERSTDFRDSKTSDLIQELSEEDGVIQKLSSKGEKYLFLHRTFQEYFSASYLKNIIQRRRWLGIALSRKFFRDYYWHETLSLLAGLMVDPIPLVRAIDRVKDDSFSSLLLLAGQCIAECEESSSPLVTNIVDRIFQLWYRYPSADFIRLIVVRLGQVNSYVFEMLLQSSLKHQGRNVRCETIRTLGEINNPRAIEPLIQVLEDPDSSVRKWILLVLGKIGNSQAICALTIALRDPDSEVRRWGFAVLVKKSNAQVIAALIAALHPLDTSLSEKRKKYLKKLLISLVLYSLKQQYNSLPYCLIVNEESPSNIKRRISRIWMKNLTFMYSDVRKETVIALGEIRNSSAVEALSHILTSLEKDISRWFAATFAEISSLQEVESLVRACHISWNRTIRWNLSRGVEIPDSKLRREVANVLEKVGSRQAVETLIQILYPLCSDVRREAAVALGKIGDPKAVEVLSQTLNDRDSDVRREAAIALGKIGNLKAIEVLRRTLNDPGSRAREEATIALGVAGSPQAVKILIEVLNDQDNDVRWLATAALGEIRSPQVVEALIQVLDCSDSKVEKEAIAALGKSGSPQAVAKLIQILDCPNRETRKWAAVALAKIGWTAMTLKEAWDVQVFEALIQALKDPDSYVRRWVVVALGRIVALERIHNSQAVEALIQTLHDRNSDVRKQTAVALGRIGDPQAVEALIQALHDRNSDVRKSAAVALGKVPAPQASEELIRILSFSDSPVRMWLAVTLARMQWVIYARGRIRISAIEGLIQALEPPDSDLRWRAASALGEIGGSQAAKALIRALCDPNSDVRGLSAAALGKIGDSQAIRALAQALSHPDREVKKEAAAALKQIGTSEALKSLLQFVGTDLYDPDIFPFVRTLAIREKTKQKKNHLIDIICFLDRQFTRFFLQA